MFLICRGEVEVIDGAGQVIAVLSDGDCFGEVALVFSEPRTATVRAKTLCDLFVLEKSNFVRILQDHPQFTAAIEQIARHSLPQAARDRATVPLGLRIGRVQRRRNSLQRSAKRAASSLSFAESIGIEPRAVPPQGRAPAG